MLTNTLCTKIILLYYMYLDLYRLTWSLLWISHLEKKRQLLPLSKCWFEWGGHRGRRPNDLEWSCYDVS